MESIQSTDRFDIEVDIDDPTGKVCIMCLVPKRYFQVHPCGCTDLVCFGCAKYYRARDTDTSFVGRCPLRRNTHPLVPPVYCVYDCRGVRLREYMSDGYDVDGFDADGKDAQGFDTASRAVGPFFYGYNTHGFSSSGYDRNGYNRHGYDRYGYDSSGFSASGYDRLGYDRRGYDRYGVDAYGCDLSGYNQDGYNRHGFHRERVNFEKNAFDLELEVDQSQLERFWPRVRMLKKPRYPVLASKKALLSDSSDTDSPFM